MYFLHQEWVLTRSIGRFANRKKVHLTCIESVTSMNNIHVAGHAPSVLAGGFFSSPCHLLWCVWRWSLALYNRRGGCFIELNRDESRIYLLFGHQVLFFRREDSPQVAHTWMSAINNARRPPCRGNRWEKVTFIYENPTRIVSAEARVGRCIHQIGVDGLHTSGNKKRLWPTMSSVLKGDIFYTSLTVSFYWHFYGYCKRCCSSGAQSSVIVSGISVEIVC